MNLNPLKILVFPRAVVRSAFEKPSTALSFIIVLLPAILFFAVDSFFSLGNSMVNPAFFSVLAWIAITIAIYAAGWAFKGAKNVKGKFSGLSSAVSYIWFCLFISGVLLFFAFSMVSPMIQATVIAKESLPPEKAVELIQVMQTGSKKLLIEFEAENSLSASQKIRLEKILEESKGSLANIDGFVILLIWALLPFFYGLVILPYLTISELLKSNRLAHFIVWALFVIAVAWPAIYLSGFL